MTQAYDAVVVGGGSNGLVAAAYLARSGLRTVVCESRPVLGGAAVSEHPFGPGYTVTSLSYVVSLLPLSLVRDLALHRHGYHVYPQGPYFAPRRDGRSLQLPTDPARRYAEVAKFSRRDAEALPAWENRLDRLGAVLGPLLSEIPPRIGSHRPGDLARQALLLRRFAGVDERTAVDITRLLTSSIADLVEETFDSDAVRGVLAVSGVIGTWAGPRSAGTAYVMAHHHVGDLDGRAGAWGFPRGGMGGVTAAIAAAARSSGAELRTSAPVARITTRGGAATGVVLDSGEELAAPVVVTTAHPHISFLRLLDRADLPHEFVADIERWKTRSGTVKINLAVDRLPEFRAKPGFDPQTHGGTIVLAESLDDVESAFQEAVGGRAATVPFADIAIPSVFDDSLAPAGHHVVSLFTQWVPHRWSEAPHASELAAYADRVLARVEEVAPGFTASVLHRQVIGPHTMEQEYGLVGGNIFHGELSLPQLFHARPAAGYADLRTPVRGLYQAGSATHGGGGVTGIPGRNVVGQVLADRRRSRWRRAGMRETGRMRRSLSIFPGFLALAALLLTAACSDVRDTAQDVSAGADKVRDCTALAAEAARTRIDTSGPVDAQDVQQAADQLGERVQALDEGDVRTAAVRLQEALEQAAEAARQGDAPALAQARNRVTEAASTAAQTCGVSLDRFVDGGS